MAHGDRQSAPALLLTPIRPIDTCMTDDSPRERLRGLLTTDLSVAELRREARQQARDEALTDPLDED